MFKFITFTVYEEWLKLPEKVKLIVVYLTTILLTLTLVSMLLN